MRGTITLRYSELATLADCQLKYLLGYAERLVGADRPRLVLGSAFHALMEGHYKQFQVDDAAGIPRDLDRARKNAGHFLSEYRRTGVEHLDDEMIEQLRWMYTGYTEFYGTDPDWDQIIVVEGRRIVPLVSHLGIRVNLATTADLIVHHRIWDRFLLIDHKTLSGRDAGKAATAKENQLDLQRLLYSASYSLFGPKRERLPVFGAYHSTIRTDQLKREMLLEERYGRHPNYYNETELRAGWEEARNLARDAVEIRLGRGRGRRMYSSPNPQECGWKCFPGDTPVVPGGDLVGASRWWYDGPLVEVTTAGGGYLAGTPNHPILTPRGWIPIGELCEGDETVRASAVREALAPPGVEYHPSDAPVAIKQVFELLRLRGTTERVAASSVNLDGQVPDHDVDVVRIDGDLASWVDPASGKKPYEFVLTEPDDGRITPGGADSDCDGGQRSALIPDRPIRGPESAVYSPSTDTEFARYRERGLAGVVQRGDLADAAFESAHPPSGGGSATSDVARVAPGSKNSSLAYGPSRDTRAVEVLGDGGRAHAVLASELLGRFPSGVPTDKIVSVGVRQFSGHVYNLDSGGLYYSGEFTVANCQFKEVHLTSRATGRDPAQVAIDYGFTRVAPHESEFIGDLETA